MLRAGPSVIFCSASAKSSAPTALASRARRQQRRLVDQVAQLGADQAGRLGGDALERDVRRQRDLPGVHREDRGAAGAVGTLHDDAPVEAARAQQRLVEHVDAVGGGQDDDAFAGVEAVHLGQDLVQRLLALVVAAELRAAAARAADGVELVDEDDRGRRLPRLLEQVAHARGADADDHLDELRGAEAEEGHARLPGDRARQQRLAGAGRADQQHALRHGAAEPLVLGGVLQEVDDLDQLVLGLVDAGDVVEGDRRLLLAVALGAAAPEAEQPAAGRGRRAAADPDEGPDQQQRRDRSRAAG